jgi:UDP-N-acetylmuramyl pentapeptide phosphotransferase/UDP-N-acetylglucosamine-1-phosphate transferase
VAFVVAFVVVRVLLSRFGRFALDAPNARSLHEHPVPRTGGIALLAGAATSIAFGALELWLPMAIAGALAILSLVDDMRGLPGGVRLAAHLAGAGVVVWYLMAPMNAAALVVLALAVAWITNLYNFMDGADGVAGGMALIGFGAYAAAAALSGRMPLAVLCVALAAAAAAFLVFNFHPARIFLGDVGSIPAGFLAGALGLAGWRGDAWPLWFPLLVFGPFIADATVTLLKRLARRERVWRAHRDHYYQRMVRMGLGHRGTALAGYAAMALCAGAALAGRAEPPAVQALAFAGASAALGAAALWVEWRWARFTRGGSPA